MTDTLTQTLPTLQDCGLKATQVNALRKLGVYGTLDLLRLYPKEHLDVIPCRISAIEDGGTVTVVGTLKLFQVTQPRHKLSVITWTIADGTTRRDQLKAVKFSSSPLHRTMGWQREQQELYPKGARVLVTGTAKRSQYGMDLVKPEVRVISDDLELTTQVDIQPLYSDQKPFTGQQFRALVQTVLEALKEHRIPDNLPAAMRAQYELMEYRDALYAIHQPTDRTQLEQAVRRLVFEEFYDLECRLLRKRQQLTQPTRAVARATNLIPFLQQLGFDLTGAQSRVLGEILEDLQQPTTMRRLVQGDVGSGKTAVAAGAAYVVAQQGQQVAVMLPTTALCGQVCRKLSAWLMPLGLTVQTLHSSTPAKARRQVMAALASGSLQVVVGTQSLLQADVEFQRLGLVVIDEEHRFGVEQRDALQRKGTAVHRLSLTATPIPRTLALTLHGDQDVSLIDALPPGRTPIKTRVYDSRRTSQVDAVYNLLRLEVLRGRQAFIVFPLIEENVELDLTAALTAYNDLTQAGGRLADFKVGLLHGKLKAKEKEAVMEAFAEGEIQVLLATTVIEVGIDVPNATVMLIHHGERFGLAQLHQLRGRVGRGDQASFCLVLSAAQSTMAIARLQCLEQSQDGFWLAEQDLQLRGQGDVLGTQQSGVLNFQLANIVLHGDILLLAREAAETIMMSQGTHTKAE